MSWITESDRYRRILNENIDDSVRKWVDGDMDSVRNSDHTEIYKEIDSGKTWRTLYRYIDDLPMQKALHGRNGSGVDPIYAAEVGDIVGYDLISTTTSPPSKAWDEWFDTHTNVLRIRNAKGIDVQEHGGDRYRWEHEILTYGLFRLTGIREVSDPKRTDYTLYELEYIDD